MIDKLLEEFFNNYFNLDEHIRGLVVYKDGNIHYVKWNEIQEAIKAPEEFLSDVYDMVGNYNPSTECVCFVANGTTQYLIRVRKVDM
ncbi:MAG: hypothetical protein R3321_00190 [Nitrososphaeraceae archaeon]|nr:hypothetical protein [Nitrososphaeraceae archaeon]